MTFPPLYDILGNLIEVVSEVEMKMRRTIEEDNASLRLSQIKEEAPFFCITNPPRHGKSLALDTIFEGVKDVLVIEITYNSSRTSPMPNFELASVQRALNCLWLRVLL